MSSQDASSTASAPSPPALHAHCRTEPAADARASDVFRKLFPEKRPFDTGKTFRKTSKRISFQVLLRFPSCARDRTHAPLASQGGRPKGRTADTQGGQPYPNSRKKPSRQQRSFSSNEGYRKRREIAAAAWLSEHADDEGHVDMPIRFDSIAMILLSENRACMS